MPRLTIAAIAACTLLEYGAGLTLLDPVDDVARRDDDPRDAPHPTFPGGPLCNMYGWYPGEVWPPIHYPIKQVNVPAMSSRVFIRGIELGMKPLNGTCECANEKKKIAVCLAGAARMLSEPMVLQNLTDNLVNEAVGVGLRGRGRPDIFVNAHLGDSGTHKDGMGSEMNASRSDIRRAMEYLKPIAFEVEDDNMFPFNKSLRQFLQNPDCFHHIRLPVDILGRAMNFYHSIERCHQLLEDEEEASGESYDIVVFSRPDIVWYGMMPQKLFTCRTATFNHDWQAIVPRVASKYMKYILRDLVQSPNPPMCEPEVPEKIVAYVAEEIYNKTGVGFFWSKSIAGLSAVLRPDGRLYHCQK